MRVLWVALLIALPLAGCLGDPESGALDCEPACNIRTTMERSRDANELSIAVNPTNPKNIIATGKDYYPPEAGDCVRAGVYVTHDGGATWATSNVAGSPWKLLDNPSTFVPHESLSKYWCVTDPVVTFAADGTAYWTVMPYQCDALSGSKTGDGIHPQGGFNDWFWTCSSMFVLVSQDGGRSWPTVREVAVGPRLEHDKQWISAAPNGDVLLCWDRDPNYQLTGTFDNPAAQLSQPGYMVCSKSTDRGRSWSAVTDVNPPGSWDGFLPWIDHASDNTAWLAGINAQGDVLVSSSSDGLQWDAPTLIGSYQNPPPSGDFGWPALNGSAFRTFALPSLAVDASGGHYDGNVYVAWMDHSGDDADILFVRSKDGEWIRPKVLHPPSGADQFMPAVSVGPDGTLDAIWYDRRDDPENHLFHLYHQYSLNGGRTWSEPLRVSQTPSDEVYSRHQNGMVFMGDYIEVVSTDGSAYPIWVDTRNGKADAYIAKIDRPGAN